MKRLYIDFDGVVMDTLDIIYKELEELNEENKTSEEVDRFFAEYDFRKIVNDDNILNDSINCINRLIESNRFEISFLTHVNTLDEGIIKIEYLRSKFKNITIIIVPKKISKTKMVHSEGAILIDDYSGNLREWESTGGIAIRFNRNLESNGFRVIDHLDTILDFEDI